MSLEGLTIGARVAVFTSRDGEELINAEVDKPRMVIQVSKADGFEEVDIIIRQRQPGFLPFETTKTIKPSEHQHIVLPRMVEDPDFVHVGVAPLGSSPQAKVQVAHFTGKSMMKKLLGRR